MNINKFIKTMLKKAFITALVCNILPIQAVNAESYEKQFMKVDQYVESQREQYNIPGLAMGIVKDQETIYLKGFGKADSKGRLITPLTPFIIGSVSKSFTALAVMQLVDEGKINLDENVDKYLPWFKATYENKTQKITVRQLLHHTSGMKAFYDNMVDSNVTIEQLVQGDLNNTELKTLPGICSNYSNANYIIIGEVIQSVTGKSFKEYITKKIFEPLEMKHSYVSKTEAVKNNLAAGYSKWFGFPVETNVPYFECSLPEGQLISCTEDMAHYVSTLINQGQYKNISIVSEEGIKALFKAEAEEEYVPAGIEGTKSYYGFGWRIIYNNDKINMIQHTGETANFHANVVIKPEERIGVIQLANFGGDMTPLSIGTGTADIMIGKEPKVSNLINNVYIAMRVILILIILSLLISFLRLRNWKARIRKSKARCIINIVFVGIINLALPLLILLYMPGMFDSVWKSSMLIFPDISWTAFITATILIIIGLIKLRLLAQFFIDCKRTNSPKC